MNDIEKMKELITKLNEASIAYYKYDKLKMSDKQYNSLYDELELLENKSGVLFANSPTQKVQGEVLEGLTKVKHSKPMLSADKTKDINEIKEFASKSNTYASWKLDGITLVVRYKNGKLDKAITRGSGDFGEDVTVQAKMIKNLPLQISFTEELELRGECVISWDNFNKINETLEEPYSHPRNLSAGSIRQLDSNITKERFLEFVVFEVVNPYGGDNKFFQLDSMDRLGFTTVDRIIVTEKETVEEIVKVMTGDKSKYPVDGLIFEYTDINYSKSLGATAHHELCRMALKWADETYETTLKDIEWNTSRTGLINPVAIFSPIDLNGAITTRATLHNISYIEDLQLGIGDIITVYRANMVIPKVDDNLTRSNTCLIPTKCPNCGGEVEIHNDNGSKTLHCINPNCSSKLLGKLTHFVSKYAMNIDGLSEATLEKFVELGWLNNLHDIYKLNNYKSQMMQLDGFGKKSVEKLLSAIEDSKNVKLENFIYSLGIPLIGRTASKTISKCFDGDFNKFFESWKMGFSWTKLADFGDNMSLQMQKFVLDNDFMIEKLAELMEFEKSLVISNNLINFDGLTFVITGSVNHYKNRDELKEEIETLGGKVSGSVSKNTNYLINNDVASTSGKNKKAIELGVKIISEEDFMKMINKEQY